MLLQMSGGLYVRLVKLNFEFVAWLDSRRVTGK